MNQDRQTKTSPEDRDDTTCALFSAQMPPPSKKEGCKWTIVTTQRGKVRRIFSTDESKKENEYAKK